MGTKTFSWQEKTLLSDHFFQYCNTLEGKVWRRVLRTCSNSKHLSASTAGCQVQRHLFRWQASGSDAQPSESLSQDDGPAEGGMAKRGEGSGMSALSSAEPPWRLSSQPSLLCKRWRSPGGRGRTSRVSVQSGRSWRRRTQHRYKREVGAEQDRITFILLLAAVEHAIG